MITVYICTTPSGKKYVGITSQYLEERIQEHYKLARMKHKTAFACALAKYGNNVTWEIFLFARDQEEAYFTERMLIKHLKTTDRNFGYNLTEGGQGRFGYKHPVSTKEKLRLKNANPLLDQFGNLYLSCAHAGEMIGVSAERVRAVVKRLRPHTRGYIFRSLGDLEC